MILLPSYKGKSVGVFGLGKSGAATINALLASGATVYASDDNATARDSLAKHEKLHALPHAEWKWSDLSAVVLAPGVPLTHPKPHDVVAMADKNNVPVTGDVELLLAAQPDATVIGITGTNGKSTTTALIAHILKEAGKDVEVGGNLGTPVLSMRALGKNSIYVLELSSYQLDLLKTARIHVACLLNFSPDHIDRHGSMEGYIAAKKHIFDHQRQADVAIIGIDDAYAEALARTLIEEKQRRVLPIALTRKVKDGISVNEQGLLDNGKTKIAINIFPRLKGRHNWQNAAFAFAACSEVGLEEKAIVAGMESFPGLAHRMEWIAKVNGVEFINDSKATNADAASKALGAYDVIYWIAGGKAKEGGIEALGEYFPRIRHAFLVGAAMDAFAHTLEGNVPYTKSGDLKTATAQAAELAFKEKKEGATVLLSPACASFDQWPNFEVRGDAFRDYALAIAKEKQHAAA
ncbi:MAG: UDP-N-acetylmuramoyl-L-alanine--D-glutamate ligase [Rickettsiales bacterium]